MGSGRLRVVAVAALTSAAGSDGHFSRNSPHAPGVPFPSTSKHGVARGSVSSSSDRLLSTLVPGITRRMSPQPRQFQRSERRPAPGPAGPPRDVTPLPDLLHGRSRSGPVRAERPVYVDLLPPCNSACPAGENIQGYLAEVEDGNHERAWQILTADNPFASIHGRVCYHPCESNCNRAQLDSAVSIHAVERFLGDLAHERGWQFERMAAPSGQRVLVIGAGPSGLSAACHLARLGHTVEIRDAGAQPGGMMRYGIPAYRLPRDVLDWEIERLAALGVKFTPNHSVVDLQAERDEGGFDAVFVAVGAHLSKRVDIPAMDAGPMLDAIAFLRGVASGERPCRAPRCHLRRWQHGDGCGADRQEARRFRGVDRLPAHPRPDAGSRGRGGGRRARRRSDELAADDQGV